MKRLLEVLVSVAVALAVLMLVAKAGVKVNKVGPHTVRVYGEIQPWDIRDGYFRALLLSASNQGKIVEMQLWTDKKPMGEWQQYAEFAKVKLTDVDTCVFVRFKDEVGNVSEVFGKPYDIAVGSCIYDLKSGQAKFVEPSGEMRLAE